MTSIIRFVATFLIMLGASLFVTNNAYAQGSSDLATLRADFKHDRVTVNDLVLVDRLERLPARDQAEKGFNNLVYTTIYRTDQPIVMIRVLLMDYVKTKKRMGWYATTDARAKPGDTRIHIVSCLTVVTARSTASFFIPDGCGAVGVEDPVQAIRQGLVSYKGITFNRKNFPHLFDGEFNLMEAKNLVSIIDESLNANIYKTTH